jgi:hypothetical protein
MLHAYGGLSTLMRARPQTAAEVLLATIVEDSPEEEFSSGPRIDEGYGLSFDSDNYPTAYWKSPFLAFLQIDADAALVALLQLVDFCTERWAHVPGRRANDTSPGVTITLDSRGQRRFAGNAWVFDWPQSNSNRSGQLHCALAALEFWLCGQIGGGADVTPIIERLLQQSNSVGVLGALVNVGKHKQELFNGVLRPLLASRWLYEWDDWRVKEAGRFHFDGYSWARQGEAAFQMARRWVQAPYRQVTLGQIAISLITRDSEVAAFVSEAVSKWELPADAKENLECRILAAQLDAKNYEATSDGRLVFAYPEALLRDFEQYNATTAPTVQTLVGPYQCEKILAAARPLSSEEAAVLAGIFRATPNDTDSEEDRKRNARVAIAATLMVKAGEWLDGNADCKTEVKRVVLDVIASIGGTLEALRRLAIAGSGGDLTFAAHAVMHRWMQGGVAAKSWEAPLVRLLTSRDEQAVGRAMHIAHLNRVQLGTRWWQLLQLAVLWSGLSMLAPGYEDGPDVEARWRRWLQWLRGRRLDRVGIGFSAIDPLAVAGAVERLHRARWSRVDREERRLFRRPATARHSQGLDTQILGSAFSWLVGQRLPGPDGAKTDLDEQDRRLLLVLWAFEVWRLADHDEHRLPSSLAMRCWNAWR